MLGDCRCRCRSTSIELYRLVELYDGFVIHGVNGPHGKLELIIENTTVTFSGPGLELLNWTSVLLNQRNQTISNYAKTVERCYNSCWGDYASTDLDLPVPGESEMFFLPKKLSFNSFMK